MILCHRYDHDVKGTNTISTPLERETENYLIVLDLAKKLSKYNPS